MLSLTVIVCCDIIVTKMLPKLHIFDYFFYVTFSANTKGWILSGNQNR
nr:MAG TPA: hypothetical protein [Caudoviricetes sp.]